MLNQIYVLLELMINHKCSRVPLDEKSWQTMPMGHVTMPGKGQQKVTAQYFGTKKALIDIFGRF